MILSLHLLSGLLTGLRMAQLRFSATYTRILARALNLKRDSMLPLLKGTDISPDDVEFERRDLNNKEQYTIIENALKITEQSAFGLAVGEQSELSMHGLLGLATMSAASLHEALKLFVKYHHVRAPFFELKLQQVDDYLIIHLKTLEVLSTAVHQFLIEAGAAMLQSMVEHLVGREVNEAHIYLPLSIRPEYKQYFHCPVSLSQDESAHYRIPRALANHPSQNRDDILRQRAEESCDSVLNKIHEHSTTRGKVEELLKLDQGTSLGSEECAQMLNMSNRTLIRRLKAEKTSFQSLLDSQRQTMASRLLANPKISIDAVSMALGYEYSANFRRAFKRWFNTTPSQFRQHLLNSHHTP